MFSAKSRILPKPKRNIRFLSKPTISLNMTLLGLKKLTPEASGPFWPCFSSLFSRSGIDVELKRRILLSFSDSWDFKNLSIP